LVLDLLVTEPVFESLIPDRLANVISLLVSSGGWHRPLIENNDAEAGFSETLGHRILDLGNVQELETQAVFPVMCVLAQQGHSFSDVLRKVLSALQVDEEQLVELLGLALGNHAWDDVAALACSCPAAHHLDSDVLLQVSTPAAHLSVCAGRAVLESCTDSNHRAGRLTASNLHATMQLVSTVLCPQNLDPEP
jgi:hypothetical protein